MINSSLGPLNVNFDAETSKESLPIEGGLDDGYAKIFDFGLKWSETYQASFFYRNKVCFEERTDALRKILSTFSRRLSANFVIGNSAYGFHSNFSALNSIVPLVASGGMGLRGGVIKLGAEGSKYGKRAIELAALNSSMSYILFTPKAKELLEYSGQRGIPSALYAPIRISEGSIGSAAEQLLQIKGVSYFERRGLEVEKVESRLSEFALFGSEPQVARIMRDLLDRAGASKLVLYPVFKGGKDLMRQLALLSSVIEDT